MRTVYSKGEAFDLYDPRTGVFSPTGKGTEPLGNPAVLLSNGTERRRLEFRWEAINALNHPQYTPIPARSVVGTPASRFLNRDYTDSGIRNMWAQIKFVF